LAGDDNFLRAEYRVDEYDAHPNEQANREIGPLFVEFIDQVISGYEAGEPPPTHPTPTPPPPAELTARPPTPTPGASPPTLGVRMIDDFESTAEHWETETDGTGSTIECGPDTGMAHNGVASLHVQYNIVPDGWVDCGRTFESPQDWSAGAGISLYLRSDGSPQWITLMLFSGDPDAPTPFEVDFEITSENAWGQIGFPWADLARAEWADEGGLAELDPARMTGYGFSLGAGETSSEGALWVDDLHVSLGAAPPLVIPDATPEDAPAAPIEEIDEESGEEETSGGGICAGAALALPLGMVVTFLPGARRRMRRRCRP